MENKEFSVLFLFQFEIDTYIGYLNFLEQDRIYGLLRALQFELETNRDIEYLNFTEQNITYGIFCSFNSDLKPIQILDTKI
jgi:hypothetical protein